MSGPEDAPEDTLDGGDVPGLGRALISLAREVWVLNDKLMRLEDVLVAERVIGADTLDAYTPSPERQAEIDRACTTMITDMLRAAGVGEDG